MTVSALIFGAIGTLAETSELQREAFNRAFRQSGLDWTWSPSVYRRLLHTPGGARRIASYAEHRGDLVDATAVHSRKVANFYALVQAQGIALRPGVAELIEAARARGIPIGWATSTTPETIALMQDGLESTLPRDTFAHICHMGRGIAPKPAPDAYLDTVAAMGVTASSALAIEDTPESARSALAAGLTCVAFPGAAAEGRAFPDACLRVDSLSAALLEDQIAA